MKAYKVIPARDVERSTLDGWELVQTIATSRAETVSCATPIAIEGNTGQNGGYSTPGMVTTYPRDEIVQVNEPVFLLSKDVGAATHEEQLKNELQTLRTSMAEQRAAFELKSTNDDRDIKTLTERVATLDLNVGDKGTRLSDAITKLHRAETALGKIRAAIGSVRYDEILAT